MEIFLFLPLVLIIYNDSELHLYKNNIKIKILNHILKDVNS
jgi:hypothetical protein